MTVDALLNLFLLTYFAGAIEIIAAGNLGYMLSHVFALTGFLLLRRDRPRWPRPIKLSAIWLPIAGLLCRGEPALPIGRWVHQAGPPYGYGWDKTRVGMHRPSAVSLLFWAFRHLVQDKTGLRLREEVPQMPERLRHANGHRAGPTDAGRGPTPARSFQRGSSAIARR